MASTNTNVLSTSSKQHFQTLLTQRQLQRNLKFKPVAVHSLEFGDDAVNTHNFLDKIQELSLKDTVKQSGGFILIRPTKGAEQFTKTLNMDDNKQSDCTQSVWDAIPQLTKDRDKRELLYEKQKAGHWRFPIFTYNDIHKDAVKKQFEAKANHSKLLLQKKHATGAYQASYPMDVDIGIKNNNTNNGVAGQKRKNTNAKDSAQPRKRQKIESRMLPPSLLCYNTDSTNTNTSMLPSLEEDDSDKFDAEHLEFYRGFCCMSKRYEKYHKTNLKKYLDSMQDYAKYTESIYNKEQNVEQKWLQFIKFFYDENTANYAHIEDETVTCYSPQSPFNSNGLKEYGPFSCLADDEYTPGIHTPYIYVGSSNTFFPWHNEDMNFHAVNHLLYGGNKIWFCIAAEDYGKVMQYFSRQFKHYYTDCLTPLQHKCCLMDPYIFLCLGINVYSIIQEPGDIVIAPPGALHCGFNESFNIAQAVNFMTMDDNQWILSLSAMLLKTHNYHDCCAAEHMTDIPCICCNKQCTNPNKRFECKCKFCDPLKCPCDYTMFLDINELAERVRGKFGQEIAPKESVVPRYTISKIWDTKQYGYEYKIYHPRKISDDEVDQRWIYPPKCKREHIYPTQDRKDLKFYPAICYDNRIIKRNELLLSYLYRMDFIAFGEYYQICDASQILSPGGVSAYVWNNPPIEKQHGFYKNTRLRRENTSHMKNHKHKSLLMKQLKGTPSFDFLKIEYNEHSPLMGTIWEHKHVIYAYPPGARKYNLEIRKKKIQNRKQQEKKYKIAQLSSPVHYVDMYIDTDPDIVRYQIEEYKDTESSSSSHSQDKIWVDSSESEGNNSDKQEKDDDAAWTPDTNKWMGTLPEYQYQGLRAKKGNRKRKYMTRNSTAAATKISIAENGRKYKNTTEKKKRKRGRPKKKKYDDTDSEEEYIVKNDMQQDYAYDAYDDDEDVIIKKKKRKKKKNKHKKSKKDKKSKSKRKKSKKSDKDKKGRTKSKIIPKKGKNEETERQIMPVLPHLSGMPNMNMNALNGRNIITTTVAPASPSLMQYIAQNNQLQQAFGDSVNIFNMNPMTRNQRTTRQNMQQYKNR